MHLSIGEGTLPHWLDGAGESLQGQRANLFIKLPTEITSQSVGCLTLPCSATLR
jgi:hypothetical protein